MPSISARASSDVAFHKSRSLRWLFVKRLRSAYFTSQPSRSLPRTEEIFLPASACFGSTMRISGPPSLPLRVLCCAIASLGPRTSGSFSMAGDFGVVAPSRTACNARRNASGSSPNSSRSFLMLFCAGPVSVTFGIERSLRPSPRASIASSILS